MRITASWLGCLARRIQGCGTNVRASHAGSPRRRHPDHTKCAVVLRAVKDGAFGGANAPSLTAPALAGSSIRVGSGRGNGCRSNKETEVELKCICPLDKKLPIQGFRR